MSDKTGYRIDRVIIISAFGDPVVPSMSLTLSSSKSALEICVYQPVHYRVSCATG